MGQIKVRIELITLLCLKEKISWCDFHSTIVSSTGLGLKFAALFAFSVHLGSTESKRQSGTGLNNRNGGRSSS